MAARNWDYIIVGAGSAGCVLANRLSANEQCSVLLLEAGGKDLNPMIHMPAGYSKTLSDASVNWLFHTQPDASTQGRTHIWPRGKVLGGSSSINGLIYVRGQAQDFDGWRDDYGCAGWGADDVLPYFKKSEDRATGADAYHGVDGPLHVSDAPQDHPVAQAMVDAGVQAGYPRNDDVNGAQQEGVGYYQFTIKGGRRCSAAVAYLNPIKKRPNLTIVTHAQVTRLVMTGKQVTAVEYQRKGQLSVANANKEVLLAAGAVQSPQILMLSGIGPAEHLQAHGIKVQHNSPAVGQNLQDHYVVGLQFKMKTDDSLNKYTRGLPLVKTVLEYLLSRRGLMAMGPATVHGFIRSSPELTRPDLQYHCMPATADKELYLKEHKLELERWPGFAIAPCQLRPESKGHIELASADPLAAPAITANYLQHEYDQKIIVRGLQTARTIATQPALEPYYASEVDPGSHVQSDDELLDYAREMGSTVYHPVGTCHMSSKATSVVDLELKVRGVAGLRVVDASIMPRIPSGNTNAATIMLAEKAADMIIQSA